METEPHHAIVLQSEAIHAKNHANELLEKMYGMQSGANADVEFFEFARLTIDDARTIKRRAYQSPLGEKQVCIIICETILHEAQNALLKIFEEPAPNTYFILILPEIHTLLPTVRSRLQTHTLPKEKEGDPNTQAHNFIRSSVAVRLSIVEPIIKDKNRTEARMLVDTIEEALHENDFHKNNNALKEIVFVRQFLTDRSSSLKMLLEHLAVSI